jgi:ribosome-binding protein aMBF1 (putative translation factor)
MSVRRVIVPERRPLRHPLPDLRRRRPRSYEEWAALRRWGKLSADEQVVAGYLLRLAREEAGLSQSQLAQRMERSQQAISQAERWGSNPTVGLLREWAEATGKQLRVELTSVAGG